MAKIGHLRSFVNTLHNSHTLRINIFIQVDLVRHCRIIHLCLLLLKLKFLVDTLPTIGLKKSEENSLRGLQNTMMQVM